MGDNFVQAPPYRFRLAEDHRLQCLKLCWWHREDICTRPRNVLPEMERYCRWVIYQLLKCLPFLYVVGVLLNSRVVHHNALVLLYHSSCS